MGREAAARDHRELRLPQRVDRREIFVSQGRMKAPDETGGRRVGHLPERRHQAPCPRHEEGRHEADHPLALCQSPQPALTRRERDNFRVEDQAEHLVRLQKAVLLHRGRQPDARQPGVLRIDLRVRRQEQVAVAAERRRPQALFGGGDAEEDGGLGRR